MSNSTCLRCDGSIPDLRFRLCITCGEGFRWCKKCSTVKALSEFHNSRAGAQGKHRYCKVCTEEEGRRTYDPEYHYRYHLRRKFGISKEEAGRLAEIVACECCGQPRGEERLHVDHDHDTGAIRGVVCRRCNYAISVLDQAHLVEKIGAYLARG